MHDDGWCGCGICVILCISLLSPCVCGMWPNAVYGDGTRVLFLLVRAAFVHFFKSVTMSTVLTAR